MLLSKSTRLAAVKISIILITAIVATKEGTQMPIVRRNRSSKVMGSKIQYKTNNLNQLRKVKPAVTKVVGKNITLKK